MIKLESVNKRYGSTSALKNVTFSAAPGEITALVGPNGSGKSTAIRALLGLTKLDSGLATIDGVTYTSMPWPLRSVGACLNTDGAQPNLTAWQHLKVICLAGGISQTRIMECLRDVGLEAAAHQKLRSFSLGMKQRMALAAAVICKPTVVILDEPQTGLDLHGVIWFRSFIRELANRGTTVLIASHALAEVERFADKVVFLAQGETVFVGNLDSATAGHPSLEDAYLAMAGSVADA
jgi:ABC-2 type transport system ATP-binding protein